MARPGRHRDRPAVAPATVARSKIRAHRGSEQVSRLDALPRPIPNNKNMRLLLKKKRDFYFFLIMNSYFNLLFILFIILIKLSPTQHTTRV